MPLIENEPKLKSEEVFQAPDIKRRLSDIVRYDRIDSVWIPINVYVSDGATAANYDVFFIADFPCEVIEAVESHRVKGTSTPTLQIEKLTSGQALDGGVTVLASAFDIGSTSTNNTPARKLSVVNSSNKVLKPLDRLALKDAGTLTAVAGLMLTVYIRPLFAKLQNL